MFAGDLQILYEENITALALKKQSKTTNAMGNTKNDIRYRKVFFWIFLISMEFAMDILLSNAMQFIGALKTWFRHNT